MSDKVTSVDIKRALAEKHYKDFFLTEVKSGPTLIDSPGVLKILDGLAIRKSWTSPCFTGYEVKVSRGDFLRDAKFYTYEELCNCLYIVCPKGMIDRTELPETIGLMYYDPERKTLQTKKKAIFRKIEYNPEMLLYIIYSRLESDRYPFFSTKQEYFKAYLDGKCDNRVLANSIKTKMAEENARLERQLEAMQGFERQYETYREIMRVLHKHNIYGWRSNCAKELDDVLSRKCPVDISKIVEGMEAITNQMKRMIEEAN